MILLPRAAAMLRQVEHETIELLRAHGFEEVVFPRTIPLAQWESVVSELGVSKELLAEKVDVQLARGQPYVLCHWQCEPYYLWLSELGDGMPRRVFDRSGWSIRAESRSSEWSPHEFVRIECVWMEPADRIQGTLYALLSDLESMLLKDSIATRRVVRSEEVTSSRQRQVVDIVTSAPDDAEVEIIGSHLHGEHLVKRFYPTAPEPLETACLGVGVSRIVRLLELNGRAKSGGDSV